MSLGLGLDTVGETQVGLCSFSTMITGKNPLNQIKDLFSGGRYVQIGVASFAFVVDCASKPGGFSRLTYDVLQWIRKVKVKNSSINKS